MRFWWCATLWNEVWQLLLTVFWKIWLIDQVQINWSLLENLNLEAASVNYSLKVSHCTLKGAVLEWLQTPHGSWSWVHQCCSPWLHTLSSRGVPTDDTISRVPDKVKDLGCVTPLKSHDFLLSKDPLLIIVGLISPDIWVHETHRRLLENPVNLLRTHYSAVSISPPKTMLEIEYLKIPSLRSQQKTSSHSGSGRPALRDFLDSDWGFETIL